MHTIIKTILLEVILYSQLIVAHDTTAEHHPKCSSILKLVSLQAPQYLGGAAQTSQWNPSQPSRTSPYSPQFINSLTEGVTATFSLTNCRILAKGGQAIVVVGNRVDGTQVVVKIYTSRNSLHSIQHEKNIFSKIDEFNTHVLPQSKYGVSIKRINIPKILREHSEPLPTGHKAIAMEFIPHNLKQIVTEGKIRNLNTTKRETLDNFFDVADLLADQLEALWEAGIIHRDLKPENILAIRKPGIDKKPGEIESLYLIDFGLAGFTSASSSHANSFKSLWDLPEHLKNIISGTVGFMSPEQIHGNLSPENDFYSFDRILATWLLHESINESTKSKPELYYVTERFNMKIPERKRSLESQNPRVNWPAAVALHHPTVSIRTRRELLGLARVHMFDWPTFLKRYQEAYLIVMLNEKNSMNLNMGLKSAARTVFTSMALTQGFQSFSEEIKIKIILGAKLIADELNRNDTSLRMGDPNPYLNWTAVQRYSKAMDIVITPPKRYMNLTE